jgi:hypothetical protein
LPFSKWVTHCFLTGRIRLGDFAEFTASRGPSKSSTVAKLNPKRSYSELPAGWAHGEFSPVAQIQCGQFSGQIEILLDSFFWKSAAEFFSWLTLRFSGRNHTFELRAIEADLEVMREFSNKSNPNKVPQLTLL